jgi:peptidyl-dipeptidase Dcp
MNKTLTALTVGAVVSLSAAAVTLNDSQQMKRTNPLLKPYSTPYQIPPFDQVMVEDYIPALEAGIAEQRAEVEAIVNNKQLPTFDNTILALDRSGATLERTMLLFSGLDEALSTPQMVDVAESLYAKAQEWDDEMSMNPKLFSRIDYLYRHVDSLGLNTAQRLMVQKKYKNFVRSGALLSAAQQDSLRKINAELTDLYLKFNKNLLNATNAYYLVVDDASRLSGIPESNIAAAADAAKERGLDGKWVFTLHAPSRLPLLQYANDRELRREIYQAYTSLASSGEFDNSQVINDIVKARVAKAHLLGFDSFADYATDNVMAGSVKAAETLLMQIWEPGIAKVKEEVKEMQQVVDEEGGNFKIAPWDYYYYAEKVRLKKYDLDENELRQYFAVDSVLKGAFTMAHVLYNVNVTPLPDAPRYYPEVNVYDVTDATSGEHLAVFMTDYFPRASKRQGAWMSEFQGSCTLPDGTSQRPIVYNVGNFSHPTADTPSLLTMDEVETLFHEFGHGLHGMLTRAAYKGQAGTNVDRDFVELPSQIHEHWAFEPEMLKLYAHHWKTGEVIPDELIAKIQAASTHNQGFAISEVVGAALLDLEWGKITDYDGTIDVAQFEANVAKKLGLPEEMQFRYRSPYFKHIFGSDQYASGYYTYLWAQVLDTDGFELFKERGIFDPATAKAFKENVLQMGGSDDPMKLYKQFRGHEPSVDALLRMRGLKK